MTQINLLPWREELRAEQKKQFFTILVIALAVGVGAVFAYDAHIQSQIKTQKKRIVFIGTETKKLDEAIKEIKEIKAKRQKLIARMEVIQNLQGSRSVIVRQIDEFVRTLPEGAYFARLDKKKSLFTIDGIAEANNRVSNLMRELTKSEWFKEPDLKGVTATDEEVESSSSQFVLSISGNNPKSKKKGGDS